MAKEQFRKFIEEIIIDGDWQYGDGMSMTNDAKSFLKYLEALEKRQLTSRSKGEIINGKRRSPSIYRTL